MIVFKARAQGASHLKHEPTIPCQDYAGVYECNEQSYGIAAVADGHGSAKYIRCETGSRLAVETALNAIKEYMENREGIQKTLLNAIKEKNYKIDKELQGIKNHIIYRWREAAKMDFEENPLSEQEKEICEKEKIDMSKEDWEVALYGTTLLFAVLLPAYVPGILAFQIGDGGSVAIDENGEPRFLEELFDSVQEGGRTNSICASSATENFKHIWLPGKFKGVSVASDGVTDSFDHSNGSYLKFNRMLFQNFENSPTAIVKTELQNYLPKLSQQGSGDDMSIAGVFVLEEKN